MCKPSLSTFFFTPWAWSLQHSQYSHEAALQCRLELERKLLRVQVCFVTHGHGDGACVAHGRRRAYALLLGGRIAKVLRLYWFAWQSLLPRGSSRCGEVHSLSCLGWLWIGTLCIRYASVMGDVGLVCKASGDPSPYLASGGH